VVLGQACQRKLVDIHVAGQIVERMRQPVDGELCHRDRDRRLRRNFGCKRHRCVKGFAGIAHLLHQSPLMGFLGRDAIVG
jgi:hypothetical protein